MSHRILATAALSILAFGSAFADSSMTATLASPTIKQDQILGGMAWRCAETTCRSASKTGDTGLAACRNIAKKFGQVAAFVSDSKEFDASQLESCNQSAKGN
jgi:hypothetical protein